MGWQRCVRILFSMIGGTFLAVPLLCAEGAAPRGFSIPMIDLSREDHRQVIVDKVPGKYLGHPSTVLLRDNKTILVVYPLGHGGPSTVLRKSTDGGLTWSDRLPVPANWEDTQNCPYIHRLTDPEGVERLVVLNSGGPEPVTEKVMGQSVSVDNGKTWTPFALNGLHCHDAANTILPIAGKRHLVLYNQYHDVSGKMRLRICQAVSSDGGMTWGSERVVLDVQGTAFGTADPDEPAIVRSPDGKQILCLLRENARKFNSLMMVSNDEGETWSDVRELPGSLTGDRHMPRYARDGRLVVTFRDMAHVSPTQGDFAAWVGKYEDIIEGRQGQYRLRLLENQNKKRPGDTGYAGLELLPDDTFVATTYCVLNAGEAPLVASMRFKLSEIDAKSR